MKRYRDIASDGGSDVAGQVTAHARRMQARMGLVRHTVAVMSGKGGVGKSSVTVNLAAALASAGYIVGILDADLNGPSVAMMTGVRGRRLSETGSGISPAIGAAGIRVMSMDLFLPGDGAPLLWDAPTQKAAYAWRGLQEAVALREFFSDTDWGSLDFLLIDLPPGADKLPTIVDVLPQLSGAVVVTTPTAVSSLAVARSVVLARNLLATPILGLVENMSAFVCPHCGEGESLFAGAGATRLATDYDVPFLGSIPLDPRIAATGDAGTPFVTQYPESPAGRAIRNVAERIASIFDASPVTSLDFSNGGRL